MLYFLRFLLQKQWVSIIKTTTASKVHKNVEAIEERMDWTFTDR